VKRRPTVTAPLTLDFGPTKEIFGIDGLLAGTYLVAALPTPSAAPSRAFVTDANATTFASIVAGGGANTVPVYFDGTNWRIG
jgi:hypothetical protein